MTAALLIPVAILVLILLLISLLPLEPQGKNIAYIGVLVLLIVWLAAQLVGR